MKVTKEATETEAGSRERGCTVCKYVQVEDIPMLEHKHGIHDETWKYDKTPALAGMLLRWKS